MAEVLVGRASQIAEGTCTLVEHNGAEIGVFLWEGEFYAYRNVCLHQGGPACQGVIMHKVEDVLGPDKTWQRHAFSKDEVHFVCPWHGWEYDIKTGECAADRSLRLRSYDVIRRGDDVYVLTTQSRPAQTAAGAPAFGR